MGHSYVLPIWNSFMFIITSGAGFVHNVYMYNVKITERTQGVALLCFELQHCCLTFKFIMVESIRQAIFSMASNLNILCFHSDYEKLCAKACLLYSTVYCDRQP